MPPGGTGCDALMEVARGSCDTHCNGEGPVGYCCAPYPSPEAGADGEPDAASDASADAATDAGGQ
jgi:hypothetical protein